MKNILVTGGKGLWACCLKGIVKNMVAANFFYLDVDELDITNRSKVSTFFEEKNISIASTRRLIRPWIKWKQTKICPCW